MDKLSNAEFLFNKVLERKHNSFTKNLLLINKDLVIDIYKNNMNYALNNNYIKQDEKNMIIEVSKCANLNIHALDEKQSFFSLNKYDEIYGNLLFRIWNNDKSGITRIWFVRGDKFQYLCNNIELVSKVPFINKNQDSLKDINQLDNYLTDAGFIKSAMTLSANYGIYDLLKISLKYIHLKSIDLDKSSCEIYLRRNAWNLCTMTIWDKESVIFEGKTSIISLESIIKEFKYAINIYDKVRTFLGLINKD